MSTEYSEPSDLIEYLNSQLNVADDSSEEEIDISEMQVVVGEGEVNIADLVRHAGFATRNTATDQERVEAIIEDRRAWLKEQNTADDVRRDLYDKIVSNRRLNAPLDADVMLLRDTNTRLYDYITRLERINASIYCPKCHKVGDYSATNQLAETAATEQTTTTHTAADDHVVICDI
ncbi:hypothetical protein E24_00065 [Faustovirus]|nr:hypothetical protein PRJ_Fausto_00058 [Faustovirus]AMN82998.1 hypothetical protein E24_00065 [Faustovirus]AMN83984.1 hypothetical protein D5a_00065 [Faustovirus]AMN84968.1 hypothetical protein E23_00065 [Faustovirus]QBR98971.1 hypothetical protein [Faustovirus mariensis]